MSKQNYVQIAGIVSRSAEESERSGSDFLFEFTRNLANYFQSDNPNFNREKFLIAAGVI